MTDTILFYLGCGWLLLYGIAFSYSYWRRRDLFHATSMKLVLAIVLWIGIASILFAVAGQAKTLVAVIDFVVFTGLAIALYRSVVE